MEPDISTLPTTYWSGWFRARRSPTQPLSVEEARRRHQAGQLYTVVLGDTEKPYCWMDIRLELAHAGVHYLDDNRRNYLSYLYGESSHGRLFLREIWLNRYGDESDKPVSKEHYIFRENGEVTKEVYAAREVETVQYRDVDVAPHWESVPAFGSYESLARKER